MTTPTVSVELEGYTPLTDPDGLDITCPDGWNILVRAGWDDITEDVRHALPITYTMGNQGHTIADRVADEGVLTLALDNSLMNSGGVLGYYSPDNGNVRNGFRQDAPVRVSITHGGTAYYQWQGVIASIKPTMGIYGERISTVEAVDYMHYLNEADFAGVPIQTNKRDDELLTTLLAATPYQPQAIDFDSGDDTYAYAFHDEQNGRSKMSSVIQKMMMSGLGRLYVRGGTATAETLRYITRSNVLITATPTAALDNDMMSLDIIRDDTSRVYKVTVITSPVQIDSSNVVLWQLNRALTLTTGQSSTFTMKLRDPNGRVKRVAYQSIVQPVADTDYKFSTVNGSGNDLNGQISIVLSTGADAIDVTVTNNSGSTGYLWQFYLRGKGVYLYEPTTVSRLTGQPTGRTVQVNMVYQDNVLVGEDITMLLTAWHATKLSAVNAVKFLANKNDSLMLAALTVQPGDYVTVKEDVTGVNSGYIVNGITKEIQLGGSLIYTTWHLTPTNQPDNVFILDVSVLDGTDILGA